MQISDQTAARSRKRFLQAGFRGLEMDAPHPGRTARILRWRTRPTRCNCRRDMTAVVGLSGRSGRRNWFAHGLNPHVITTFKLTSDDRFAEKLEAIVGLYVGPPERALELCCDEKCPFQALDQTQPGLRLKPGRAGTMTHNEKSKGTATIFAALNGLDGQVTSLCQDRHRHQEWMKFRCPLDDPTRARKNLHRIADNHATPKHPEE